MFKGNLAFNEKDQLSLIPEWTYFVNEISKVFKFSDDEIKWFKNCKTAKLIYSIPFVAGCIEPERTAIAHLCIYIAEIKGFEQYFSHQPSDDNDLYNRLAFISTFEGGNRDVIEEGMDLLALIMLEGYHNSEYKDKINHQYNPLVSGKWNYIQIKKEILNRLSSKNESYFNSIPINPSEGWRG